MHDRTRQIVAEKDFFVFFCRTVYIYTQFYRSAVDSTYALQRLCSANHVRCCSSSGLTR